MRPARHPGRWFGLVVVAVLAAMLVNTLLTNPRFEWDVVGQYFTTETILPGLRRTIDLTLITMLIAVVLGIVLAVLRLSPNPILSGAAWLFVWFFRGTPLLVQLLVWYNLAALYPDLSVGIPFGPEFVQLDVNVLALESLKTLDAELANHAITVTTELAPGLPAVVGNRGQLREPERTCPQRDAPLP